MNKVLSKAIELTEKYDLAKGAFAKDSRGESCPETSSEVRSLCTMGFLNLAYRYVGDDIEELYVATNAVRKVSSYFSLAQYNDLPNTTKQDIIELFRKANESSIP